MSLIKILTPKEEFRRIYREYATTYYIPRNSRNCHQLDWLVSLYAFGSDVIQWLEFTPKDGFDEWRITQIKSIERVAFCVTPSVIQQRYKARYSGKDVFYRLTFEG